MRKIELKRPQLGGSRERGLTSRRSPAVTGADTRLGRRCRYGTSIQSLAERLDQAKRFCVTNIWAAHKTGIQFSESGGRVTSFQATVSRRCREQQARRHKEHRLSLSSGLTILWARQPAVLARRGCRLNTPSAWRHPSNNSPFPMTLAATPHYRSLEPGRNISLHACGTPLPLS